MLAAVSNFLLCAFLLRVVRCVIGVESRTGVGVDGCVEKLAQVR